MTAYNPASNVITVWSDIACPWASLALHTLHERAEQHGVDLRIDHRVFPLELVNSEPTSRPMYDQEVQYISAVVPDVGWQQWSRPAWEYPVTVLPAIHAVQAAKFMGLEVSDALDLALRRGFFSSKSGASACPRSSSTSPSAPGASMRRVSMPYSTAVPGPQASALIGANSTMGR